MPPIGEGAVPTAPSTIGSGAAPSHHHAHKQHRAGSAIGSGVTPSSSPPTIGSGARPTTTTKKDPFAWTIGTGAQPTNTTTTERKDPFANSNKPRTSSSLFPPQETKNERSSSLTHISIHDEPKHNSRSNTVCRVETSERTTVVIHRDDAAALEPGCCSLFCCFPQWAASRRAQMVKMAETQAR